MREKLQTLPLAELKELAKAQGIKGYSSMRKPDIINILCEKEGEASDSAVVAGVLWQKAGNRQRASDRTGRKRSEQTARFPAQTAGEQPNTPVQNNIKKTVVRTYRQDTQQRPYRSAGTPVLKTITL